MKLGIALSIALSLASSAFAETSAVHGMLIFGEKVTYGSHLPMFHSPHNYQSILKLNLQDSAKSQALLLFKRAKALGKTLFTLAPEPFEFSKIMDGSLKQFKGELYEGHFEKDGINLGQVKVTIEKNIYSSEIQLSQPGEGPLSESYLLFGSSGEYFGLHLIQNKPSFDAVVQINQPYRVSLFCGRRDCSELTPKPISDQKLPIKVSTTQITPQAGQTLGQPRDAVADIQSVVYLSNEDLSQ